MFAPPPALGLGALGALGAWRLNVMRTPSPSPPRKGCVSKPVGLLALAGRTLSELPKLAQLATQPPKFRKGPDRVLTADTSTLPFHLRRLNSEPPLSVKDCGPVHLRDQVQTPLALQSADSCCLATSKFVKIWKGAAQRPTKRLRPWHLACKKRGDATCVERRKAQAGNLCQASYPSVCRLNVGPRL